MNILSILHQAEASTDDHGLKHGDIIDLHDSIKVGVNPPDTIFDDDVDIIYEYIILIY